GAGDRGELVRDAADAGRGDRRARERREEHAAQRVTERRAVAGGQRLAHEPRVTVVTFEALDLRIFEFDDGHGLVPSCCYRLCLTACLARSAPDASCAVIWGSARR